jgi:hypothetical protein
MENPTHEQFNFFGKLQILECHRRFYFANKVHKEGSKSVQVENKESFEFKYHQNMVIRK